MKQIQALIVGAAILVAGCSTSAPRSAGGQQTDASIARTLADARLLCEMGKYDDAERKLQGILAIEPSNRRAQYYLAMVRQARDEARHRQPEPRYFYQTIPQQPVY